MVPLLYVWGDDELVAERLVDKFAAELATELGAPLERWSVRAEMVNAATLVGQLYERLATGVLFGGGTLAVVRNPGALARSNATRDRVIEAIALMSHGNGLVIVEESTRNDKKTRDSPGQKRLSDALVKAGGRARPAFALPPARLGQWIQGEASDRGIILAPGAANELADRLGSRVTDGDVDRRHLSRIASNELDKLALRHAIDSGPITPDDVRQLVVEATPGSMFALTDAVGNRRPDVAMMVLDRVIESTPEPVVLMALHRRIRDLIEVGDRFASGQKPGDVIAATSLHPFVVEKLQGQARLWTIAELARALGGLVELDAMVKGVPGREADAAQRRLAFTMWVREHAVRDGDRR